MTVGVRSTYRPPGRAIAGRLFLPLLLLLAAVGLIWAAVWSPVARIADIGFEGIPDALTEDTRAAVEALLDREELFGILSARRSLLVADAGGIAAALTERFPALKDVRVAKAYPDALRISATARTPMGAWCRGDECWLWDRDGARWGTAAPSVGPLLLLVRDERTDDDRDPRLLTGILTAVDGLPALGLAARTVTLPDAEPGGIRILVNRKYELYVDALAGVPEQLDTLGIFLTDKANDPAFNPVYIDLRTPGRVYFK